MDEFQINSGEEVISDEFQINSEEEVISDEFYEKIEAPKFVDLDAPDRFRTENDDRYWFCHRVGCDQKHEEEMDSEAIYKSFVLRVMAARSPSVGLRKALHSRSNLECPRTVPAKSSKSRVSKLAMISSISQKMGEAKVKVKHVPKQSSTTPDVNKKGISNPGTFQSVRNPKPTIIEVPKDRLVAKALVFRSPKKVVKLKKSVEWSNPRKICKGMKKLKINDGNKTNNKRLDAPRKQLRTREVRSRVYDSLHFQSQKTHEAKSLKPLKKRNGDKDLSLSEAPMCHKPDQMDPSDRMKQLRAREVKSRVYDSLHSQSQKTHEAKSLKRLKKRNGDKDLLSEAPMCHKPDEMGENVKILLSEGSNEINERSIHEENIKPCSKDNEIPEATENDDKENALAVEEIDNKENAAASDENIKLDFVTRELVKKDVLGRHETSRNIQKVTKVMNKTMKQNSTAEKGIKYRKPKPTNPKPFRLRTDERRILKEANLEKKHLQAPLKETTFHVPHSGNSLKKHQNVETNETCLGQNKTSNCAHEGSEEPDTRMFQDQPQCIKSSSSRVSTTQQKRAVPMHKKMTVTSLMKKGQDKAPRISNGNKVEKTKSPTIKQLMRPRGVASSRKKLVSVMKPGQLDAIKEISTTMAKETSDHNESGSGTSLMKKASSQRRRHTTIPREPNFHNLHAPKSCTKRVCSSYLHASLSDNLQQEIK